MTSVSLKRKPGRPRKYTPDTITECLRLIREGASLRQACRTVNIDPRTLYNELDAQPAVFQRYARALEGQADAHRESILELAVKLEAGGMENNDIQALRVAIDARKWVASKLAPKVYGDYAGKGPDTVNISVEALHLTALKQLPSPEPIQDAEIIEE